MSAANREGPARASLIRMLFDRYSDAERLKDRLLSAEAVLKGRRTLTVEFPGHTAGATIVIDGFYETCCRALVSMRATILDLPALSMEDAFIQSMMLSVMLSTDYDDIFAPVEHPQGGMTFAPGTEDRVRRLSSAANSIMTLLAEHCPELAAREASEYDFHGDHPSAEDEALIGGMAKPLTEPA